MRAFTRLYQHRSLFCRAFCRGGIRFGLLDAALERIDQADDLRPGLFLVETQRRSIPLCFDEFADCGFIVVPIVSKLEGSGLRLDKFIGKRKLLFVDGLFGDIAEVGLGISKFLGITQGVGHHAAVPFFRRGRNGNEMLAATECDFTDGDLMGMEHGLSDYCEGLGRCSLGVGSHEIWLFKEIRRQFLSIDELRNADRLLRSQTNFFNFVRLEDDVFALAVFETLDDIRIGYRFISIDYVEMMDALLGFAVDLVKGDVGL